MGVLRDFMDWVMKHKANGVDINGYHYSGEVVSERFSAKYAFNINYYLKEMRIRVGPVFDEQERIVGLGRYYYGDNSRMSLKEALRKLEEIEQG